nr:hypothetical protein C5F59_31480 [Streptomyces sp. QL37]
MLPTRPEGPVGLFKGTTNLPKQAGVSTYLALTFGTLLSSQGTDASFGPVSPGPSGRFPSFLRFRLYQTLSCPIPGRSGFLLFAFQFSAFAFPFRRGHYISRFPRRLIIESMGEFRHAEIAPARGES